MADIVKAAADLEKALTQMEKEIAQDERMRKMLLDDLDHADTSEISRLQDRAVRNKKIAAALQSVETALRNSKASFERMAAKADKDLATISRHVPPQPLSVRHLFLVRKLTALKKAEQQLEFLCVELEKMSDTVNWKLDKANPWSNDRVFLKQMGSFYDSYGLRETESFDILKKQLAIIRGELESKFR
jgi:phenylalanyl-tRNA synthetase alpha subunit